MSLLDNIRKQCRQQKITIDRLEKAAGLAPNTIYKWNRVIPGVDKVQKVAKVLNATVDDLLNNSQAKEEQNDT